MLRGRRLWAVAALAALPLAAAACIPGGRGHLRQPVGAAPVFLMATQAGEGTLSLISPSFRCGADYCAGYVLQALQALGEAVDWRTAAIEGQDFIELRVLYDPARIGAREVLATVVGALERHPDPRFPAGVDVTYLRQRPEALPVIVSSERTVGPNRLLLVLLDPENRPIADADVTLRLYRLSGPGGEAVPIGEVPARPLTVAVGAGRPDEGTAVAYAAEVAFPSAGRYRMEVSARRGGRSLPTVALEFRVTADGVGPKVGEPAPTLRPYVRRRDVAEALERGRPAVVAFASPDLCFGICLDRPLMAGVVAPLSEEFGREVLFIQLERYDLQAWREGRGLVPSRAVQEWGLVGGPWLFVLDGRERVTAKFEGPVSHEEVEQALRALLSS